MAQSLKVMSIVSFSFVKWNLKSVLEFGGLKGDELCTCPTAIELTHRYDCDLGRWLQSGL
jgi:hypothetical protein